jgi:hypothetical protein
LDVGERYTGDIYEGGCHGCSQECQDYRDHQGQQGHQEAVLSTGATRHAPCNVASHEKRQKEGYQEPHEARGTALRASAEAQIAKIASTTAPNMLLRIRLAPSAANQPKTTLAQLVFIPSSLSYPSLIRYSLRKACYTKLKIAPVVFRPWFTRGIP